MYKNIPKMIKSENGVLVESSEVCSFYAHVHNYSEIILYESFDGVVYIGDTAFKVDEHTATPDDVYAVQKNWLEKKKSLHTIIPHTEIKEVDLWISEAVTLVRDKEWEDAISKIEVLIELSEQIPKTFTLSLSNIL